MAAAMRKLGFCAAFLVSAALAACQTFTAEEKVSEPDPAQVKRGATELKAVPKDDVHSRALQEAKNKALEAAQPGAKVETATASHILIRYAGALRTSADVTRSKEDARKLAEQVLQKVQASGDFAAVANEYTEDPTGKGNGGKLGTFPKGRMVPEFDQQVFALQPGGVSGVVETGFGFHLIKRDN
jgi:parvulin-like peptidyl-prolyl isomerase